MPLAETPQSLITEINRKFLTDERVRPHEPLKTCFKLDMVRDWKSWFESLGKRITGLLGPSAPHTFEFQRRDRSLDLPAVTIVFEICFDQLPVVFEICFFASGMVWIFQGFSTAVKLSFTNDVGKHSVAVNLRLGLGRPAPTSRLWIRRGVAVPAI